MTIKKFALGQEHGYIGDKPKAKPKPIVPYVDSLINYKRDRNICYYIQHGGECEWSEEEVEFVRGKYFKTLF